MRRSLVRSAPRGAKERRVRSGSQPVRQKVRGDVLRFDPSFIILFANFEAYPAGFHHADQQLLLPYLPAAPNERVQQRTGEAAAQLPQLPQAGVSVEDGVDRLQSPALVKDDAVFEQALAVEHDAGVVQIVEQEFGSLTSRASAQMRRNSSWVSQRERLCSCRSLASSSRSRLQSRLDPLPRRADSRDAMAFVQRIRSPRPASP